MRISHLALMISVACILCEPQLLSAQPANKTSKAVEDERSQLYQDGIKLAEKGNWKDAVEKFRRVVQLRPAPAALFTLAEAEQKVGRLATARRAYSSARVMAIKAGETTVAEASAAAILALEPSTPRVRLRTTGEIARVTLDGDLIELVDDAFEADPGAHDLAVTLSDGTAHSEQIDLRPGARPEITVNPASTASSAEQERGPALVGPVLVGVIGVVTGIVGVALYVQGEAEYDDACGAEHICTSQDSVDTGNAARARMIGGDVMIGLGVAALAGGAVWLGVEVGLGEPDAGGSGAALLVGAAF